MNSSVVDSGGVTRDELIEFLNELLEAEHAGARVTLESSRAAGEGAIAELMRAIQQDEARWCSMLRKQIRALGGEPSAKIGPFYKKAMAVSDLDERIAFLNRGQNWVVKKLREMISRLSYQNPLKLNLVVMLQSHEVNIKKCEKYC